MIPPKNVYTLSLCVGTALLASGCVVDPDDREVPWTSGYGGEFGDDTDSGDGDGDGDGDPDPTGDGDPDPTTTGDGDGDPDPTGDGDPDPTTTGDGDGDCDGDSPYMGGWDIGCCQDQVVPGAWSPGQGVGGVPPDWTFTDQFGDAVRLYDFCHEAIYFEYVALW